MFKKLTMVKTKNQIQINNSSEEYQIKTRNREKKIVRGIKSLQEIELSRLPKNLNTNNTKEKNKNKYKLKKIKQTKKNQNNKQKIQIESLKNQNISKKNKIEKKLENIKIYSHIYKYIYQSQEFFELKEVLTFINEELKINLDSSNNKIKDKEIFISKMNDMFEKLFVIYFNKILITEGNLVKFLTFLSNYIKLDVQEIIKILNMKSIKQKIEEKIILEQYFKPKLILVEK